MTANIAQVVVAVDNSPADLTSAEGYVVAVPSGEMWPDTSNEPIVPMVVHGQLVSGTCTLSLVASDNYTTGVLTWDFIINIRGLPTVNVSGVSVPYSGGTPQNVWSLLQAAGWTPTSQP
jgi:hypothetical protein